MSDRCAGRPPYRRADGSGHHVDQPVDVVVHLDDDIDDNVDRDFDLVGPDDYCGRRLKRL